MSAGASGSATFKQLAYFQLDAFYEKGVVRLWVQKMKDGEAQRWVYYKNETFESQDLFADGVPVIRRMTEEELAEHKAARGPKPNIAAENATDASAVSRLAEDVQRYLRAIKVPTLLRDFALLMMQNDPQYLDTTKARLSEKDSATMTEAEVRERCVESLIKRLGRAIGNNKDPGVLYPFVEKTGGRQPKLPNKDRRFKPIDNPAAQHSATVDAESPGGQCPHPDADTPLLREARGVSERPKDMALDCPNRCPNACPNGS